MNVHNEVVARHAGVGVLLDLPRRPTVKTTAPDSHVHMDDVHDRIGVRQ